VGRLLVPGEPPRLGKAAGGCQDHRRQEHQRGGVKEREDVAKLNAGLQQELAGKGLTFNQPNVTPFRDKLRSAGFYAEWKGKYGDQAWELLEKSVGKLS
jgi:TRAP-type C4-dicarboxylate transport system substrate-binding protein